MTVAALRADRVVETTTTSGVGQLTLAGAYVGIFGKCQTFASAFASGVNVFYTLFNDTDFEIGVGAFTGPNLLARDAVFSSSNAGALVNLPVGSTHIVFCTDPAQSIADVGLTLKFAQRGVLR